ncbi:MAG: glycosyltransferase family 4 protein [Sphingomonas sp.]|nr:glycosyltransferase family 4 protein [Sphingomonas sp.]
MRLLMTVDSVGGVWQYATDLARALGERGVETILALLGPIPPAEQRDAARAIPGVTLVETGLPLDWLADTPDQVRLAGSRIAELARHMRADIVQLNQPALAAGVEFPVPIVAAAHSCLATWWSAVRQGPLPEDFAWRATLHGHGLRAAARMIAPSHAFAEATRAAYDLPQLPITVHNGRAPLPLPPAALHDFALTAGRLWDKGKNVATLDRAAARLGVPIKALGPLAGPDGACVAFAHLHTPGSVSENALAGCLAARPVFVSAAKYEPFGLAVLEAASAGCPLVLSDIPTFREVWSEAAIFVDAEDDRGFAAAIEELIGDTALRLAQGEKARAVARAFTPARMADQMLGLYGQLSTPGSERVAA